MSDPVAFFLNSSSDVIQYECVIISHPSFSKTYRIVRNNIDGLVATLNSVSTTFEFYPLKIKPSETSDNLDFAISIEFGDLGESIPEEIDRVIDANTFLTKPTFQYIAYRSDDLTAPMVGPLTLEIQDFAMDKHGCAFEARAARVNVSGTGLRYTIDRFPSLRAFA